MSRRGDPILVPGNPAAKSSDTDDKKRDLRPRMVSVHPREITRAVAYRDGEIHDMRYLYFVLVAPYVVEHVFQDMDGLVPHEPVVPLLVFCCKPDSKRARTSTRRTSENAGAAIFR